MLSQSETIRRLYAMRRRVVAERASANMPNHASEALRLAREEYARGPAEAEKKARYESLAIWSRVTLNGAPCVIGGVRGRWIEQPYLNGWRKAGTPESIGVTRNTGYYLDPHGMGETVSGVVYQLPARKGRAVFLAGYADPFGNGGAFLALAPETADDWREARARVLKRKPNAKSYELPSSESLADDAKREAARRADQIAERMAEEERERAEAYAAGAAAREKAREALEAGKEWVRLMREARNAFATRRARGVVGITLSETLASFAFMKERIRAACEDYQDKREEARSARDDIGAWLWRNHGDAIREGYDNA